MAWLFPGNVVTALSWLILSALFSWYIGHFGDYDATYGNRHDDADVDFNDRRASRGRTECRNPAQDERRLVDLLGSFLAANADGGGRSECEICLGAVEGSRPGWNFGLGPRILARPILSNGDSGQTSPRMLCG